MTHKVSVRLPESLYETLRSGTEKGLSVSAVIVDRLSHFDAGMGRGIWRGLRIVGLLLIGLLVFSAVSSIRRKRQKDRTG